VNDVLVWAFGWLWWTLLPVRKRVAVDNYRAAFPARDPGELRRTVGELVVGYLDLLRGVRARVEGLEHVQGGAICLAGHGSAWDVALVSAARHVPTTITVKEPSNALARRLIRRIRAQEDLELLPPKGSMGAAYAALERGRLVMLIQDQRYNPGLRVPFFGRPALTSPGFGAMAWRTRRKLVGYWQRRLPDGSYLCRFQPLDWEIPEDREQAVAELTARSQQFYEEAIAGDPPSWLWLHDRWKLPG
jgi:Kdo2-lipid IVA lauroyltransferase/acyltransferase